MNSVWVNSIKPVGFESLNKNIETDVLIIGGGIAGILCAYNLKKLGVDSVLVEAKNILSGITKNTTAKITLQHGLIYQNIIKKFGFKKAQLYLKAQNDAISEYRELCQKIDCDYEIKDSFVYSLNNPEKIKNEVTALNSLGQKAEFLSSVDLPFKVAGAVQVKNQAQFNPLKFLYQIAKDMPIYENTKVIHLLPNKAITNHAEINYKKTIVATHFPILNKHGGYFLKMYQHRSYVLALDCPHNINAMYVDEDEKGLSFRRYGDLLLLGGGGHRTGKKGGCWKELEDFASKYYKDARIVTKWATQDCITLDGVPYIGPYSKQTPNLFVVTGFNKWGMSSSMVGAKILCDLVQGKENKYASVFLPSRSMYLPKLAINAIDSTVGLLTPTAPRCPHLGCALKYNAEEHSWDCPCHGSRFTEKGELIDNPATDDKRF